jgi:serine/threonine protein kinase
MEARELTQIGPYTVRRFIAEGGMAWVFEVLDPRFEGRDVVRALKMLKPAAAVGDEFQRFTSEASLLAGIDHPNLVTIFDFGKDEATDCFYYTMTFVGGPTMAVSIENTALVVKGDRASLEFDQRMAIARRPGLARAPGRASQRSLLAHDAHGNWALDQILGRN